MKHPHTKPPYEQQFFGHDALSEAVKQRHDAYRKRLPECMAALKAMHESGAWPVLQLPSQREDLDEIEAVAHAIRDHADYLVVLGTGGSSLGGQTLVALSESAFPVYFMDNLDPHSIERFFARHPAQQAHVLMVSKSGGTVETLAQAALWIAALRRVVGDAALPEYAHAITEDGPNPLRALAEQWDIPTMTHDAALGGRYSVLSLVGLIPAAVAGVDMYAVRAGADAVLEEALRDAQAAPYLGAAWQCALMPSHPIAVWMPYADRLATFGAWVQQLWAESLGKQGKGSTAVRALGAVDQHSQLQLYLDGPADKSFHLLTLNHAGRGPMMDAQGAAALAHLAGKRVGDVMQALQFGTVETLKRHQLPLRVLAMEDLDAYALGALLMHLMLETMLAAHLLGVNAFDQPAVEEGKQIARDYLRGMGGEQLS